MLSVNDDLLSDLLLDEENQSLAMVYGDGNCKKTGEYS